MDDSVARIKITKKLPLDGKGGLEERLKKVSLRGWPDVKIYENASFSYPHYEPEGAKTVLSTSQPHVFQTYLDRIGKLDELFSKEDVDIFNLTHAYDYEAYNHVGEITEWTMLPPVVEVFTVPQHAERGGFDYGPLVGHELKTSLQENGWSLNDAAQTADYHQPSGVYRLINDGAHRVEAGLQSGRGITVVEIQGVAPGFPYYTAPQPYGSVQVFPHRDDAADLKIHVVNAPAHKQLYRLFPSGGIYSGAIRPPRGDELIL